MRANFLKYPPLNFFFSIFLFLVLAACSGTDDPAGNAPDNGLPQASITANPSQGTVGVVVSFSAIDTGNSGSLITSYQWDFGDGNTGVGARISHTYVVAGNYTTQLTLTNQAGLSDSTTTVIVITDATVSGQLLRVDSVNGDDSNTRTQVLGGRAWKTLGRALWGSTDRSNPVPAEAVAAGEIVEIVDSATYTGASTDGGFSGGGQFPLNSYPSATFATVNSGTNGNPIIVRGAVGQFPVLQAEASGNDTAIIGRDRTWQNNYVRYENLKIYDNVQKTGIAPSATVQADFPTQLYASEMGLFNCKGTGFEAYGVEIEGRTRQYNSGASVYVQNGVNYVAVRLEGSIGAKFINGKVYGLRTVTQNRGTVSDTYGAINSEIAYSTIWDSQNGIQFKENTASGLIANNNTAHHNLVMVDRAGISLSRNRPVENRNYVYQNIVIGGSGIGIDGSFETGGGVFANNTIIDPQGQAGCLQAYSWGNVSDAVLPMEWKNNICITVGTGRMVNMASSVKGDGTTPSPLTAENWDIDHNLYYEMTSAQPGWIFRGTVDADNLTDWQAQITAGAGCPVAGEGRDCNSQYTDPLFVDFQDAVTFMAGSKDPAVYQLQANSPAENAGINAVPALGVLGVAITQGAYITGNEQIGADW